MKIPTLCDVWGRVAWQSAPGGGIFWRRALWFARSVPTFGRRLAPGNEDPRGGGFALLGSGRSCTSAIHSWAFADRGLFPWAGAHNAVRNSTRGGPSEAPESGPGFTLCPERGHNAQGLPMRPQFSLIWDAIRPVRPPAEAWPVRSLCTRCAPLEYTTYRAPRSVPKQGCQAQKCSSSTAHNCITYC